MLYPVELRGRLRVAYQPVGT